MAFVAIALGSNLGDRGSLLNMARSRLRGILADFRTSSDYDTEPQGMSGHQPRFLNAAAVGTTSLSPQSFLRVLELIEREGGRERPLPGAARTLDLDLVLWGREIIDEPNLTVPHPRFRERRFVLEPLAEIAGDLEDPVTRLTIAELLSRLNETERALRASDVGRQIP